MNPFTLRRVARGLVLAVVGIVCARAGADAVDDYVRGEMSKRHIPGVAVAVVREGKVVKVAGYGEGNVELHVPVSGETVFQIQSVTKTFTSAAVLMLVEEGKVDLGQPVSTYLEGTPESWKGITIRHLLSHTSGIKDFINEPTASLRIDVSEEDVFRATVKRPVNFQPGEKYQYCNTNYHLLAMIIRKLTGKGYGEFLKERIFTPLEMNSTRVVSLKEVIANRASGYSWDGRALKNGDYVAESILGYGGGGVVSTAGDMAKWLIALDGEKVLKKETIELAWTPQTLNDGKRSDYGLGWGLGEVNGRRWVGHGGAHMTGFTSNVVKYRDDGLGVVVLTNARHANPGNMGRVIAALVVPGLTPPARKAIEDKEPGVAELVREVGVQMREGRMERERFTPELWASLSARSKELQEGAKGDGAFKRMELLERSGGGGDTTSAYRMVFAKKTYVVRVTVNGEGKVSGLWAEEE